jgi:hypothetical protein
MQCAVDRRVYRAGDGIASNLLSFASEKDSSNILTG